MNLYHLKDKPVKAIQWNGNIKAFKNGVELMLKTNAIAMVAINDIVYIACDRYCGMLKLGEYFVLDEPYVYEREAKYFEQEYEV